MTIVSVDLDYLRSYRWLLGKTAGGSLLVSTEDDWRILSPRQFDQVVAYVDAYAEAAEALSGGPAYYNLICNSEGFGFAGHEDWHVWATPAPAGA